MAHWFKTLFAATGTKTAVPDATDPSGYISYETGYGPDYQRVLGTDPLAKTIERDKLNQVLYDITGAVQQYQTHGFPDYIDATANGGIAYAYGLNAIVRFTDGLNYRNTVVANTNDPSVSGWVLYNDPASAINSATSKTTPVGADELGIYDSVSGLLNKLSFTNLWASLSTLFAPISSPAFIGTPTAPNFSYKPTPVTITSWSYVTTTITINVASHTFVAGDYIEVGGLTATTNIPNGVHLVTSVTATTIVYTYALTPTGTAGVSSATVKGYMTTNGRVEAIGEGQTWQNPTRVINTTYTNNTGKTIWVNLMYMATSGNPPVTVNGKTVGTTQTSVITNTSFPVPNGSSYIVNPNVTIYTWSELR